MTENFIPDSPPPPANPPSPSRPNREPVKILLIGSRQGIAHIIHGLYRLGFAEVSAWSKPQAFPNSKQGEMMSITVKHITLD